MHHVLQAGFRPDEMCGLSHVLRFVGHLGSSKETVGSLWSVVLLGAVSLPDETRSIAKTRKHAYIWSTSKTRNTPIASMYGDPLGRKFQNLRVSLTAACNYACTYCVPDGKKLMPLSAEMDGEELLDAVKLLVAAAGIDRLRITGGEPLLSPKFDEFLMGAMSLDLEDIAITTNGQFVAQKYDVICASGLRRMNVSLDTLKAEDFRKIARSGDLETVLNGIDMLLEEGLHLKINTVPMRSLNVDQIVPLLDYCLERGIEIRYIELMNMGHLKYNKRYESEFVSMEEILGTIASVYEFERAPAPVDSTSVRFAIPGKGTFGIIANESEPFCGTCSRLRLSSNGFLFGCLSNARSHPVRQLLDLPRDDAIRELDKILGRAMGDKQTVAFTGETTVMKFIGG